MTPVAFIERLLKNARWYPSALELDDHEDGELLHAIAARIVEQANAELPPSFTFDAARELTKLRTEREAILDEVQQLRTERDELRRVLRKAAGFETVDLHDSTPAILPD